MANRRMINKSVIDSDAFLDMPSSTQNLYFHLNMRADDDGFLDNPKKVMREIGANQNDLEILLAKRYLLVFDSSVIVIKHWKLHNSIRKDRYKPTLYQEELKTLIEKENGVYTEAYKALEDRELNEWQPNGNQLSTNGTRRLGQVRSGEVREGKEEKNTKKEKLKKWEPPIKPLPSQDPIQKNASSVIQRLIDKWNSLENLQPCRYQALTIGAQPTNDILEKLNVFSVDEIEKTFQNLNDNILNVDKDFRTGSIKSFFSGNGFDRWTDEAKPWERFSDDDDEIRKPWEDEEK